jgi:protein TonB
VIHAESRRVGGVSPGWFLFVSLSFHIAVALLLIFYHTTKSKGFPEATTVELVSEVPPQKQVPITLPPRQVVKKLVRKPLPVHPSSPVRHLRVVKKARIPLLQKKRQVKPAHLKKTAHRSSVKPVQKKKALHPPSPLAHHVVSRMAKNSHPLAKPVLNPSKVPNPHPAPVKMDISGQSFPTFLEHLLISRIKSNWFPPPGTKGLKATVQFVLMKNGHVSDQPVVVGSSGNTMFDDAARMAILRSVPFPPFPPGFSKDKEVVTVTLEAIHHGGVLDAR